MKPLGGTMLLALILTLVGLYFLKLTEAGGIALLALICMSVAALTIAAIKKVSRRTKE
jgi:hypothetical protein